MMAYYTDANMGNSTLIDWHLHIRYTLISANLGIGTQYLDIIVRESSLSLETVPSPR